MKNLIKYLLPLLVTVFLSGCVTSVIQDVQDSTQTARNGTRELPKRNITDFAFGLQCMDDLFINFGYSPNTYVILLEDITDKTKKVDAGTREMMISAISDMTRRSQAIQVIAYGKDSGNLVSFLSSAEHTGVYQNIPPYDVIGSISQLDKDIIRKQADVGGQVGGTINGSVAGGGFGASASNAASILGLDLSIITSHNMAVIPGVTTRNAVALYKSGKGGGIDAGISKTGVNYSISSAHSDGTAQGLRALVELSTIELVGKLAKLPYWTCLGLDPAHETLKREISDWHYQLNQSQSLHTEMKVHLYLRGYYDGPIDETVDDVYQASIIAYKQRLGLASTPLVDIDFYSAFLNDSAISVPSSKLAYLKTKKKDKSKRTIRKQKKHAQSIAQEPNHTPSENTNPLEIQTSNEDIAIPLSLSLNSASVKNVYTYGEDVFLSIKSNHNGYVACYLESQDVFIKIFPNRFSADGYLSKKGVITLPDSPSYSITSDKDGEKIHCLLSTRQIQTDLPGELRAADFEALAIQTVDDIVSAYEQATSKRFAQATYTIRVK